MTIKEKADEYIGHPQEVDEGSDVSLRRKAFIDGAEWMLKKAYRWLSGTGLMVFIKAMNE